MSLLIGVVEGDAHDLRNTPRGERAVRIDKSTRALTTISYEHHEIHAGSLFIIITYNDNLASSSSINIVLTTPDTTKEVHMLAMMDSSGEFLKEIYHTPAVTAGSGNAATPLCRNLTTSGTPTVVTRTGMTVVDPGTIVYRHYVAAGKNEGVLTRDNNEWVLDRNTTYLFRLTSYTAASKAHIELDFYEHTPRS